MEAIMSKWQLLGAMLVGALGGLLAPPGAGPLGMAVTLCVAFVLSDALAARRARVPSHRFAGLARALWQGASLGGVTALSFVAFSG
jgi:hypothetical protein